MDLHEHPAFFKCDTRQSCSRKTKARINANYKHPFVSAIGCHGGWCDETSALFSKVLWTTALVSCVATNRMAQLQSAFSTLVCLADLHHAMTLIETMLLFSFPFWLIPIAQWLILQRLVESWLCVSREKPVLLRGSSAACFLVWKA